MDLEDLFEYLMDNPEVTMEDIGDDLPENYEEPMCPACNDYGCGICRLGE